MLYKEYNPSVCPQDETKRPVPAPFLTIHQYGVFAFNRSALKLLEILPEWDHEVVFFQASSANGCWYVSAVITGGFKLRPMHAPYADGTRRMGFNNRALMRQILQIPHDPSKGTQFILNPSPVDLGHGRMAYLMQPSKLKS